MGIVNSEVKKCDCVHETQDRMYGKSMRLHNKCATKSVSVVWRCTICRKEKSTNK